MGDPDLILNEDDGDCISDSGSTQEQNEKWS